MQHYCLLLHLMNFKQLEDYFIKELSSLYEGDEAKQLFYLVTDHISGWSRGQLMMNKNEIVATDSYIAYEKITAELKTGKPLQHITGVTWFYGLKFKVSRSVLIPRPETEELVEWILADIKGEKNLNLLDIGTGSGCIAISIKANMQAAEVSALDISEAALKIAKENAGINKTAVNFIHSDILSYHTEEKYAVIVSNPPYIKEDEKPEMHQNVLAYEPHLALFVSNENPLIFYSAIADFAVKKLKPAGKLYFEINEYLGEETMDMLGNKGFKNRVLRQDLQGKDRMICCSL